MSEEKGRYASEIEDSTNNALAMMGTGYDHPSIEIEQEQTVIQRRNGKLESFDKPAFVKLSTAFKQELPEISGDALKVWIFIALSINRKTEQANPGLRTIAESVKLAVNTVQKCLKELEGLDLLIVDRKSRKYNIYKSPEYVSANRSEPVSQFDTIGETVSNETETVSNSAQTVSPSVILNQSNQKKPELKPSAAKPAIPQEVKIYREVTGKYPNRATYESVQRILESVSARLGRPCTSEDLRPFYTEWIFRGFNPINMNWTSWAVTGIIPQAGKPKQKDNYALENYIAQLEAAQ